jgi:hypothetical protein
MTFSRLAFFISKYSRVLIVLCWLITTLLYLQRFGLFTVLESEKYISEAKRFIDTGNLSAPRYWFYCTTIFIIALALKLKIGLTGAFVVQGLLNIVAYLLFYTALKKVFKIPATAFFVVIYLLLFLPYQSWVVYLYTESAFFSSLLILLSVLMRYKPTGVKNVFLLGLALLFVIVSRPLGILFAAAMYVYLFYMADKKWKLILGLGSILFLILAVYVINTIFSTIPDWRITQAFEEESIICDLPGTRLTYATLDLAATGSPVYKLFFYVTHNFRHFLHFSGVKLQYFFLMARPYYSNLHNNFLLVNTACVYLLVLAGLFMKKRTAYKGFVVFMAMSILLYTLTIILQCDDYHNRFILSIYPFFVILAAMTAEYLALHFFKNNIHAPGVGIEKTVP